MSGIASRSTSYKPLAQIVELRGPLGPGGVQVYGIAVVRRVAGTKPIRTYIEVMEDQIELIPAKV
jgi:hypothetical protein